MRIFVSASPFGSCSPEPIELLDKTGWDIIYNPLGRRLKNEEISRFLLLDIDGVIAGTERYDEKSLLQAKNLKVIARVGVGIDNIDFDFCKRKNITVTYTPDAPSEAVADLTVAQIINLLRGIHISDKSVRNRQWNRFLGKLVSECSIGILGLGRIGRLVAKRLYPYGAKLYACDLVPDIKFAQEHNVELLDKHDLFLKCDLITIHIPMNSRNFHCVGMPEMSSMKRGSYVINTSRGKILDEDALSNLIINEYIAGAALDVFSEEPYDGMFSRLDNVLLTAHIGASAKKSRYLMEMGATEDCVRVLRGEKPHNQAFSDD